MLLEEEVEKFLTAAVKGAFDPKTDKVDPDCALFAVDAAEALLGYYKVLKFNMSFAQTGQRADVTEKQIRVRSICARIALCETCDFELRIRAARSSLC